MLIFFIAKVGYNNIKNININYICIKFNYKYYFSILIKKFLF